MRGLADDGAATAGVGIADVGTRHDAEGADERRGGVRQQVTVKVGRDDDVVGRRLAEELVEHRVDNLLLDADGGRGAGPGGGRGEGGGGQGGAGSLAEEAVGLGEDVGLVGNGDERSIALYLSLGLARQGSPTLVPDLLTPLGNGTGHASNAERGRLGDLLDGLCHGAVGRLVRAFTLDVQVLGVFADDNKVDRRAAVGPGRRRHERAHRLDGPDVGVQVELFAQCNNG